MCSRLLNIFYGNKNGESSSFTRSSLDSGLFDKKERFWLGNQFYSMLLVDELTVYLLQDQDVRR
jgi:hypothetical protein